MSTPIDQQPCDQLERVTNYALRTLPIECVAALEAHLASCSQCRRELDQLLPMVDWFDGSTKGNTTLDSISERLARRLTTELGREFVVPTARGAAEPDWAQVAP